MSMPKSYRTHRRVPARGAQPQHKAGFSLDDLMQETMLHESDLLFDDQHDEYDRDDDDDDDDGPRHARAAPSTRAAGVLRYARAASVGVARGRLAFPGGPLPSRVPMQVQVARISPVVMELAVEVPADEVKVEVEKAYSNAAEEGPRAAASVPARPRARCSPTCTARRCTTDVVNALVNGTLPKALTEQKVQPINQPQVEAGKFDQAASFSYKARFEVSRRSARSTTRASSCRARPARPARTTVDEQLEMLRKQHARLEPPEPARPAQKGDVVTIDFTLEVDGAAAQGRRRARGCSSSSARGRSCPSSTRRLVGKKVDDEFDVETQFPDAHPREELKGKSATFNVKVKDMKERILPALDDEFAKDVGNFQTLVELRADIHTRLEKMMKDRSDTARRRTDRRAS